MTKRTRIILLALAALAALCLACGNPSPESRTLSGVKTFVEQAK